MESAACGGKSNDALTCARQHSAHAPACAVGVPVGSFGTPCSLTLWQMTAADKRIGNGLTCRPAGGNRRQHLHHQSEQDNG